MRLEDGALAQCGSEDSVRALARIVALTPAGAWGADRKFGARNLLEGCRAKPDLLLRARESFIDAFRSVGVSEYEVTDLKRRKGPGADEFTLFLRDTRDGSAFTIELGLVLAENFSK